MWFLVVSFLYGEHGPRPHSGHPRLTPSLLLRSDLPRSRNTQHEVSRNKKHKKKKHVSTSCLFHNCNSLQQKFDYWGRESLVAEVTRLPIGLPIKCDPIHGAGKRIFSPSKCSDRLWSHLTYLRPSQLEPHEISPILTPQIPKHLLHFYLSFSKSLI